MGLKDRLAAGFKNEFAGQVIAITAGALMIVALARLLSPEGYGLLYLTLAILHVAQVFSKLGIAKSGARYLAEYKQRDDAQVPHILKTSLLLNLTTILIVAVILLAGHRSIANLLDEPGLVPLLLLGTIYLVFGTLVRYVRLTLQGYEKIQLSARFHIIETVTRLLFAVGLVLLGFGVLGALGGYIVGAGLVSFLGLLALYTRIYRQHDAAPTIEESLRKRIATYSIPITATSTADIADKRVDTILVGFFLNPIAVGFYVVAKQAVEVLVAPAKALGFTLSPTFGAQQAKGANDQAATIYEGALNHALLFYIPAAAGVMLLAEPAIVTIFGPDYRGATPVLQILAVYAVLHATMNLTSSGLDYLGKAKSRAIAKGVSSTLNVILNILLIPLLGVTGAAYATVATYAIYAGANFYIIDTVFDLDAARLGKTLLVNAMVTLAMVLMVLMLRGFITGWLTLAGVVLAGGMVWAGFAYVVGLLDLKKLRSLLS